MLLRNLRSIQYVLILLILLMFLTSCSSIKPLEVFNLEVKREPLNLDSPDIADFEDLDWYIITSENAQEMFAKLVHMPTKSYDFASSGELLSKLTYDTEQVAEAATKAITVLVRDGLTVIGLLGLMFYQSFILSVGLFVIGPVIAIFIKIYMNPSCPIST